MDPFLSDPISISGIPLHIPLEIVRHMLGHPELCGFDLIHLRSVYPGMGPLGGEGGHEKNRISVTCYCVQNLKGNLHGQF